MAIKPLEIRDRPDRSERQPSPSREDSSEESLLRTTPHLPAWQSARRISFFGHFVSNFGNAITLQAVIQRARRIAPHVEISCICTDPSAAAGDYGVKGVPISGAVFEGWLPRNRVARALRSVFIGMPNELCRWFSAFAALAHTDALIIPGTGLLTDAYGIRSWGPYSLFTWSVLAKLRGRKILFVSVGAGPLDSRVGRWTVRCALALADFRSYRDNETKQYLSSIGAAVAGDRVYPDLAFSVVEELAPKHSPKSHVGRLVGIGVMLYHEKLSSDKPGAVTNRRYLEELAVFAKWLLERGYDIRLLIGDLSDTPVLAELKILLRNRLENYDERRILDDPVSSVEGLLAQIAETDVVVATRFHNVLLALALNKPSISISFHQKCSSLMSDMGLSEYCQDIRHLDADKLVEQFCRLEKNAGSLRNMIREKVAERRQALDEQYQLIFKGLLAAEKC